MAWGLILLPKKSVGARLWGWLFGHDRSIGFGLEYLGHLTLKKPRIVATFVVVLSIFCVAQLPRLSVDGDMLRVFAHSGHEYDAYEHLADTFGTFENDIYVLVKSPKLTDPDGARGYPRPGARSVQFRVHHRHHVGLHPAQAGA